MWGNQSSFSSLLPFFFFIQIRHDKEVYNFLLKKISGCKMPGTPAPTVIVITQCTQEASEFFPNCFLAPKTAPWGCSVGSVPPSSSWALGRSVMPQLDVTVEPIQGAHVPAAAPCCVRAVAASSSESGEQYGEAPRTESPASSCLFFSPPH